MVGFKIGILGAGDIAATVADTLMRLDGFENYAIASRSEEKAQEYKEKFGFEKSDRFLVGGEDHYAYKNYWAIRKK